MNLLAQLADTDPPPPPVKVCTCGEEIAADEWLRLQWVGEMSDGDGGTLELRNHHCGSTISILKSRRGGKYLFLVEGSDDE